MTVPARIEQTALVSTQGLVLGLAPNGRVWSIQGLSGFIHNHEMFAWRSSIEQSPYPQLYVVDRDGEVLAGGDALDSLTPDAWFAWAFPPDMEVRT